MIRSFLQSTFRLSSAVQFQGSGARCLSSTGVRSDLMEFFDSSDNWGAKKVRVGRHWLKDELRLKSNEDLHKLWYVLLKERNMLLTMIQAYEDECEIMPNEERLDKVDESMSNLEEVARERNRAYYDLEVGDWRGEQEREVIQGPFGIDEGYLQREHTQPFLTNKKYQAILKHRYRTAFGKDVKEFHRKYMEMTYSRIRHEKFCQLRMAANLLKRFPETKEEAMKEKFPLVKWNEVTRYSRSLGHHQNLNVDFGKMVWKPRYRY